MKFSEDILRQFDLEPQEEREPVNVMQIREMLEFMRQCAERIVKKSRKYLECSDEETKEDCIDIVTATPLISSHTSGKNFLNISSLCFPCSS